MKYNSVYAIGDNVEYWHNLGIGNSFQSVLCLGIISDTLFTEDGKVLYTIKTVDGLHKARGIDAANIIRKREDI